MRMRFFVHLKEIRKMTDKITKEYCDQLFQKIVGSPIELDHVIVDGVKYYNHENKWYGRHPDDESNIRCDTYWCRFSTKTVEYDKMTFVLKSDDEDLNEEVFPKEIEKITLINISGTNEDHRGSDHVDIDLNLWDEIDLGGNTLGDLATGFFCVKSHKFDNWYELYCGVKRIEWNEETKTLEISIWFDHGS